VAVVGGPEDFAGAASGFGVSATGDGASVCAASVSVVSVISSDVPFEPFSSGLLFLVTFGFVVFVAMSIFRLFIFGDNEVFYFQTLSSLIKAFAFCPFKK
jgi:hypothetical protein